MHRLLLCTFCCCALAGPALGVSYFGELTVDNDGLVAGGNWDSSGTSLAYDVSFDDEEKNWLYSYTLRVADDPWISHLVLETSEDRVADDFTGWDSSPEFGQLELKTSGGDIHQVSQANWDMPEAVYGMKIGDLEDPEEDAELVWTVSFLSDYQPIWGDAYFQGGNPAGGNYGFAYNAGFTDPDTDPVLDLGAPDDDEQVPDDPDYHLLVPDTETGGPGNGVEPSPAVIPEPLTMFGLGAGVFGLGGYMRRRRMQAV